MFPSKINFPNVPSLTEYAQLCNKSIAMKMSATQHLDVTALEIFDDEDAKPRRVSRKRKSVD